MATCSKCRYCFRVPEDEEGMHECPRCGWDGREDDIENDPDGPFESDFYDDGDDD